jgi:signal transduction histidine kinase
MRLLQWIMFILLSVIVIVLLVKNYLLKKSMREIYADFENCLSEDTNVQITVSSGDKTVTRLAKAINLQLTKLRKIKQQYSDGDRELKEAITNISHDLRTPLTAICGYLDLLEKQNHSEDTERYIEQIRNRSEVLKQLTEELFRYSIISSTPELSYEKVNLCRVLEESLISFEGTMQQVGIQPEIQMPSVPVWRTLDHSAVVRVFGNIINNAIRYSDGDFEVHLEENGKITFSNTANKLTTVEVGKLFDRFYTVDTARKSTGLGLAIAKTLVEKMNGKIEANIKNKKLNIVICFPE